MWSRQGRGRASLPQLLRQFHDSKSGTIGRRHAGDYPDLGQRFCAPVHPMGRARGAFDPWAAGLSGRGEPSPVRAACRAAEAPPSLDPRNLPEYAARTTLRMLIAMVLSLLFTFTYATLAAKNKRAERLLVPLLDILQSVPILGFISVTVVFFMALAPGRVLGAEFAAIFAIFTSQAWNMAFSFYQSLRTVPTELDEASRNFRLSAMDEVLAARCAVRHAAADLEHDDVDVGELVLRRRLRGDQRRQHHRHAARRRLLHRAGHRAPGSASGGMGDRDHAGGDPDLRPGPVPAAGGMGGSLPLRAGSRRAAAAIMGVRRLAPIARRRAADPTLRRAVAAHAAAAAARQTADPASNRCRSRRRWIAFLFGLIVRCA